MRPYWYLGWLNVDGRLSLEDPKGPANVVVKGPIHACQSILDFTNKKLTELKSMDVSTNCLCGTLGVLKAKASMTRRVPQSVQRTLKRI